MRLDEVVEEGALIRYGDPQDNTGPVDVIAVSPTGVVTTLLAGFDSENIDHFRRLGGSVFATSEDPRGANPASLATNHGGSGWHSIAVQAIDRPVAIHLYDITLDPITSDYLVCGSREPDVAFVWRSNDLVSWTEDLAHEADGAGFNRFYGFRSTGGTPVVTTSHGVPSHYVLSDGEWVPTDAVTFDPDPEPVYDLATLDAGGLGWTAAAGPDGGIWLCDSYQIFYLPPD